MSHTVVGIFEFNVTAQKAKDYLVTHGFESQNVDINTSGVAANDNLAGTADGQLPVTEKDVAGYTGSTTNKTEEDDDSIGGFFRHLFGSHEDDSDNDGQQETLRQHIQAGRRGVVVTVHADSQEQAEAAADALDQYGAVDVDKFSQNAATAQQANSTAAADSSTIQVMEENLKIGKRNVETGGVRLRSRIVERPVEEKIRLREEHVTIERHPVSRPASEADFAAFKEGTIEMTEHAEQAVIAKEARVVEEVSLGKAVSEKEEVIKDTVRHTEVDTENINPKDNL